VAVNCCEPPVVTVGAAGVTEIAEIVFVPAVTVKEALAVMPPAAALMVAVPAATAVAKPVASTLATAGLLEVQVTFDTSAPVDPSLYTAFAVNCCVAPTAIDAGVGTTEIDFTVTAPAVTLTWSEPVTPSNDAVTIELPAVTPVITPVLLIFAVAELEDVQVTDVVRSAELPSL